MKRLASIGLGLLLGATSLQAQIDVERTLAIGRNAIHFQDYIVSLGYFNQVIGLRPWMAEPYFYRAVAKINLEDYAGAEEDASLALERNPIFPRAYLLRGVARFSLKDFSRASGDFRRGLELSPKDQSLLYNLAISLLEDKQLGEAERVARELLELDAKNKDALRVLAQTALEKQDTIAAGQAIDQLLHLDSLYRPALLLRAQIAIAQEDYTTALQQVDYLLSQDKGDAGLYTQRAILRYHLRDFRGAMSDYSEALRLDPQESTALNNRALLRTQVGEYRQAIQDWSRLIQTNQEHYIAYYNRALLYSRTGEYTAALHDLDRVLKRYPAFAAGFAARADVRQRIGDAKGATRDQLHLFDLQTNASYRNRMNASGRQAKPQTRTEEDQAIEKYNQLIETPAAPAKERPRYTSQLRGRVQDDVRQGAPRRDLLLSYFAEVSKEGNQGQVYFVPLIDRFNLERLRAGDTSLRLVLREDGFSLSQQEIELLQHQLAHLGSLAAPSPEERFLQGVSAYLLQDLDRALSLLNQALEQAPQLVLARLARASVQLRRSEIAPAISSGASGLLTQTPLSDLNEVIRLAPDFAEAYYNRANLHARAGDNAQARRDYDRALSLSPHLAEAYFNRGLLSYSEGKIKEGTSDLSKAGELGLYQAYSLIKRMNN